MTTTGPRQSGEEWGPWVIHDGAGCPVAAGTIVEVVFEDRFGFAMRDIATASGDPHSSWDWRYYPELKRIIRYREKKPRGMQILREQIKEIDAPRAPATRTPEKTALTIG